MRVSLPVGAAVGLCLVSCAGGPGVPAGGDGGGTEPAADLAFLPAKPRKGSVFALYNHHGPSRMAGNWTSRFDFSGVAWNDSRTATAISRNHVVMAAHFVRPTHVPLVFHDRDGRRHVRHLRRVLPIGGAGDVAVGRIDEPLPPEIAHYRLATAADAVPMRLVLVTDQTRTISLHRLGRIENRKVVLGFDPNIPRTYWRNLVTGDSGNPAIIDTPGGLRLLGTFSTGGPGTGPFFGDPEVAAAIADAMRRLP